MALCTTLHKEVQCGQHGLTFNEWSRGNRGKPVFSVIEWQVRQDYLTVGKGASNIALTVAIFEFNYTSKCDGTYLKMFLPKRWCSWWNKLESYHGSFWSVYTFRLWQLKSMALLKQTVNFSSGFQSFALKYFIVLCMFLRIYKLMACIVTFTSSSISGHGTGPRS